VALHQTGETGSGGCVRNLAFEGFEDHPTTEETPEETPDQDDEQHRAQEHQENLQDRGEPPERPAAELPPPLPATGEERLEILR